MDDERDTFSSRDLERQWAFVLCSLLFVMLMVMVLYFAVRGAVCYVNEFEGEQKLEKWKK